MKKCPNGHIYPDSLPQCPVCEKEAELQTILGKSCFTEHLEPKQPEHNSLKYKATLSDKKGSRGDNKIIEDADRTVFIGHSLSSLNSEAVLGGWLIESNCDEVPVGSFQLFLNRQHAIGRSNDNDIVLISKNKSVSRHHCLIEYKEPHFIIHDKNSANGIIVNNQSVVSQRLSDNDVIILGDQKYWIKYLSTTPELKT